MTTLLDIARPAGRLSARSLLRWVPLCALLAGSLIRLRFVLQHPFPLNDGGLFYQMTQELQRARYALPHSTAYNQAGIPFAYPPLGFYLAGLLDDLGPWSLLDVFRWLPLALNIATIAAFYPLARALLPSRAASAAALTAFALLPGSYAWQIMGGGVTRALGFLFATLAVHRAYLLYTEPDRRQIPLAVLCAAGAVLSHLAMAQAAAAGIALLFLARGRSRAGLQRSLLVAVGTLALTSPWWGTVIARHGLAPFAAASGSPESPTVGLAFLSLLLLTDEPYFPLLAGLALLGVMACLGRRRYLLPAWLAALYILDPRTARTTATLPLALLAGSGLATFLLPALQQSVRERGAGRHAQERGRPPQRAPRSQEVSAISAGSALELAGRPHSNCQVAPAGTITGENADCDHGSRITDHSLGSGDASQERAARPLQLALVIYMLLYALLRTQTGVQAVLVALAPEERQAMQWVAQHTPAASTFLVVTGDGLWGGDRSSEWFPVLAERVSVATVQGREWLPGFMDRASGYTKLQACADGDVDALEEWAREEGLSHTHLYIPKREPVGRSGGQPCCQGLRASLGYSGRYAVVYDGPGATVYARGTAAPSPAARAADGGASDG